MATNTDHDNSANLSLKVVINKQKTKVLYAEANTNFINILLSFLTLPFVKILKTLLQHDEGESSPSIGSLNTLYTSLLDLDDAYFCVGGAKQMLLNPPTSFRAKLAVDHIYSDHIHNSNKFFLCEDPKCPCPLSSNVSLYCDIASCKCGKSLNRELPMPESPDVGAAAFVSYPSSFIVTDDLTVVKPMTGIVQMLRNFGSQGVEMLTLNFGINEIRDLLKLSLTSATPLTDLVFKKTLISSTTLSPKPGISLEHILEKDEANPRKIVVKACLQRSTNKFLFAIAPAEFVELLFSFLTAPLGGIEFLLGGNTGLNSIDNLYRSVSNGVIKDECFTNHDIKTKLINPKIPHGYVYRDQLLPLSEDAPPKLYYDYKCTLISQNPRTTEFKYHFHEKNGTLVSSFKLNEELYVKKLTMCIVTDDLTVSPSLGSSMLIINRLGIPPSDVKEMELHVGIEEALSILKASLTSKTALTDGLIKPSLNKLSKLAPLQPKQET